MEQKPPTLKTLECKQKYAYNKENDNYIVFLPHSNKLISVTGERHRRLQAGYCGEPKYGVEDLCYRENFPSSIFDQYKRVFGWKRSGTAITDEELMENSIEDSVKDEISHRKVLLSERVGLERRRETEEDAKKWKDFVSFRLDPYKSAIDSWKPPKLEPLKASFAKPKKTGRWFVMSCSDFQIGAQSLSRYMFRQGDWNSQLAAKSIDGLIEKIAKDVDMSKAPYQGAYILLAGDLFHGLNAETEKGTLLDCDITRDDQCDAVLEVLYRIIGRMREVFGKVVIHTVRGNHDGTDFYPVMLALQNYFKMYKSIDFNLHSSRTAAFKIENTGVILDHGASDIYKNKVPKDGKQRESYIQSMILSDPKTLVDCNQRLFITGDMHTFEHLEYNDFEFIRTGALPLGDQYADNSNLHSRPRQNCFVIDAEGLKETKHYYIDTVCV